MIRKQHLCPGSKNVFDLRQKQFFLEQQNLFPQHMFPARLNWEKFASATRFPSLARSLLFDANHDRENNDSTVTLRPHRFKYFDIVISCFPICSTLSTCILRDTAKCNVDLWITRVINTSTGINRVRLAHSSLK